MIMGFELPPAVNEQLGQCAQLPDVALVTGLATGARWQPLVGAPAG
jgi:hypothetical protein